MTVDYRAPTQRGSEYAPCPFPWLTIEVALYAALVAAALALRLAALGRFPLSAPEASMVLTAWRTVRGGELMPTLYSPLLVAADMALFWLTRATDAATRLVPALAGAALVALPFAVRRTLGRGAALVTATLLAFAPSWVFYSRTGEWPIVATALAAGLVVASDRYRQSGTRLDARLIAVLLGAGLAAGPGLITPLLVMAAYGLLWARGRSLLGRAQLRGLALGAATRDNVLVAAGVFVALASALWVNPAGIGAAANLMGHWVGSLAPGASGRGMGALPTLLLTYEFLTVALAIAAGVFGARRRAPLDALLLGWAALALVLGVLLGHRGPEWLLDALLPLVVLAGRGAAYLWEALRREVSVADAVALVAALALGAFALLEIAGYLLTTQQQFLIYGLLVLGALVLAWVGFWLWGEPLQAARVGTAVVALFAIGLTVRTTTAIAYQTARDPREPLVGMVALPQAGEMNAFVALLSDHLTGDTRALEVAYERDLNPWAAWYLRDYAAAHEVASVAPAGAEAPVLLAGPAASSPGPTGYVGQRFILSETRPAQRLSPREAVQWLLYRAPVGEVERTYLHVWVQAPGASPEALQRTTSTP